MTDQNLYIGVVGTPEQWSSNALADAVAERTGFRLLVDLADVVFDTSTGTVCYQDIDLCTLDGLVVKKLGSEYSPDMLDRLELIRYVASHGVPVLSSPTSIQSVVDRLSGTITLSRAGIPMPPTVVTENVDQAVRAVERFGKAVVKPLYSTKARGMRLLVPHRGLAAEFRDFQVQQGPVLYVQQMLDVLERDLGVAFLGGEYLGTYARVRGKGAWNTTVHSGGSYAAHDPSSEVVELARRAQALFDLEFTTVDVVETPSGLYVFEVSAFGGFRGLKEGLGIDAAARLADHVVRNVVQRRSVALERVQNA